MYLQKVNSRKQNIFVAVLKVTNEKSWTLSGSGSVSQSCGSGSVPKYHGSGTQEISTIFFPLAVFAFLDPIWIRNIFYLATFTNLLLIDILLQVCCVIFRKKCFLCLKVFFCSCPEHIPGSNICLLVQGTFRGSARSPLHSGSRGEG
jgi:hypothetical protein